MKLIVKCKECRAENKVPNYANDRVNYAKSFGDELDLTCTKCNAVNKYEVDDINAVKYSIGELIQNQIIVLGIVAVIAIVLKIIFWKHQISWFAVIAPVAALIFFITNDSAKQLNFNSHKLKGRIAKTRLKR